MNLTSPLSGILRETDAAVITALQRTTDGFTGRRLESLIGATSRSALLSSLDRLQTIGLIRRTDIGNAAVYTLNRAHLLWTNGIEDMLETPAALETRIAGLVAESFPAATVAVFGSVARGDATLESDVDLVVLADVSAAHAERRAEVLDDLDQLVSTVTGNALQVIWIDFDDLSRLVKGKDLLLQSWLGESRTIAGPDLRARIRATAAA
ncbi:MAG: nucleotidyltransferase domain-containing protein [Pseudolysinimonas sp.]